MAITQTSGDNSNTLSLKRDPNNRITRRKKRILDDTKYTSVRGKNLNRIAMSDPLHTSPALRSMAVTRVENQRYMILTRSDCTHRRAYYTIPHGILKGLKASCNKNHWKYTVIILMNCLHVQLHAYYRNYVRTTGLSLFGSYFMILESNGDFYVQFASVSGLHSIRYVWYSLLRIWMNLNLVLVGGTYGSLPKFIMIP